MLRSRFIATLDNPVVWFGAGALNGDCFVKSPWETIRNRRPKWILNSLLRQSRDESAQGDYAQSLETAMRKVSVRVISAMTILLLTEVQDQWALPSEYQVFGSAKSDVLIPVRRFTVMVLA